MELVGLYFAVNLNKIWVAHTLESVRSIIGRLERACVFTCASIVTREIAYLAYQIKVLGEPSSDEFYAVAFGYDGAADNNKGVRAVIRVAHQLALATPAFSERRGTEQDRHECGQRNECWKTG